MLVLHIDTLPDYMLLYIRHVFNACSQPITWLFVRSSLLPTSLDVTVYLVSLMMFLWLSPSSWSNSSPGRVWKVSSGTPPEGLLGWGLVLSKGSDRPDVAAPGVAKLELNPTVKDSKGRKAGSEPATMPIPSSIKDQNPIFPVPYMNSPGSLYSARYRRRTMVAQLALMVALARLACAE